MIASYEKKTKKKGYLRHADNSYLLLQVFFSDRFYSSYI